MRTAGLFAALAFALPGGAQLAGTSMRGGIPGGQGPIRDRIIAAGDRFWVPGKERVTIAGVFVDETGTHPARIVIQLPRLCRLDVSDGASQKVMAFDGSRTWTLGGQADAGVEAVLESLADDSIEAFVSGALRGANIWLAGSGYRLHDSESAFPQPRRVDVLGVLRPAGPVAGRPIRRKMYCFDSESRLLNRVMYRDSSGRLTATVYEAWDLVDGEPLPTVWTRRQEGKVVFSFRRAAASFSAGLADATFGQP